MINRLSIILVISVSLLFFAISGFFLTGSLNNQSTLAKELHSPKETIYSYYISKKPPFKHRILFPVVVKSTYSFLKNSENNQLFYLVYTFWSAIFFIGATLSFFFLLQALNFEKKYVLFGVLLFLISPAVFSAYTYPVHTREDLMSYMIINLSLIFVIRKQVWGIFFFSVLGVLCRETLLLFPLIFFLYENTKKRQGFYILLFCILVFLVLRFGMGDNHYDILKLGLQYNLDKVGQSIGFLFLVFSFMWFPFLYDIYFLNILKGKTKSEPISILRKSSLFALTIVLISTFIGGRINEIRLIFILFPWIIPIFLYYFSVYSVRLLNLIKSNSYKTYIFINGILFLLLGFLFYDKMDVILEDTNSNFPYSQWVILSCFYFFIFFLCIPFYALILKKERSILKKERSISISPGLNVKH